LTRLGELLVFADLCGDELHALVDFLARREHRLLVPSENIEDVGNPGCSSLPCIDVRAQLFQWHTGRPHLPQKSQPCDALVVELPPPASVTRAARDESE